MASKLPGLLLALIFALFFVPNWILSLPEIQQELRKQTAAALDANVTLKSAVWAWYPLPHVSFEDFSASGREFHLTASLLDAYPAWGDILTGRFGIDGIALHDPDFLLLSVPSKKEETRPPMNWIKVTNGRFRASPGLKFQFLPLKDKKPHLTGIYGRLEIDGDRLSGRASGKTGFAQQVAVDFSYDLVTLEFALNSKVDHLDIARLYYKNITTQAQFPAEGFVDLHVRAKGKAMEYLDGSLDAASECLISKTAKPGSLFSCGTLRLFFHYRPDDLVLDIRQLEFVQPGMKLAGKIRLNKRGGKDNLLVDLSARDVDVGQVRKSVLSLFRGEKLVRQVCDIVRGGQARTLSFYFNEEPRFLESLHCMLIKGELESVPLYIPDQHLFLDSVSGKMTIKDAMLWLEDARVKLRNSRGSNGLFVYGLADGQHELELDIDLDADLRDVKWALRKFVNEEALNEQLEKVADIKGRAQGRFMLGDDERDIDAFVDVYSVKGQFFYKQLNWPVRIEGGSISYAFDTLGWKNLAGRAGKHRVDQLTGRFSWKGRNRLVVEGFSGTLDASAILAECSRFPALEKLIQGYGLRSTGSISVGKCRAKLFLDDVQDASYSISFRPLDLRVETSLLPGPLTLKKGAFLLNEQAFSGKKCQGNLAGSKVYAWVNLKHLKFQGWRGSLEFSGGINHKVASWVERHGWVPSEYFPRVPVYLKNFRIELLGPDHQHVSGRLSWKKKAARADLDIEIRDELLDIRKIHVISGSQEGTFSLLLDQGKDKRFSLAWKGTATGRVLDMCLRKNDLLRGSLYGDLSLDYKAGDAKGFHSCRGSLRATGLFWPWGLQKPLFLRNLVLDATQSTEGRVLLQADFGVFEDLIDVTGDLSLSGHEVAAYLDLYGEKLSDKSLRLFLGPEEDTGTKQKSPASPFFSHWNLDVGGEIAFDFDTVELDLNSRLKIAGSSREPRIVPVNGVNGFGKFELGRFRDVRIFAQSFCGLFLRASVKIDENGGQHRALTLGTGKDAEVPFEKFLACTGVRQRVLTGPFSAKMELTSPDGIPEAVGSLWLHASKGNIKKFGLLSRILGVVNLVDLFSAEPGIGLIEGGFPYDEIILKSRVEKGVIHLDHAVIKGRGLNLYGAGNVDLQDGILDLIVFVAPLKTVDRIITSVPIIGAIIGGKHRSLITIPVKVSGPWDDPQIRTMPAKAVADVFEKLLFNVIRAPFSIFSEMESGNPGKSGKH